MMTRRLPALTLALVGLCAAPAAAQRAVAANNPVFFDDSTAASETLGRAADLAAAGNAPEAVRALQRLLDDEPERLHSDDGVLFVTVRQRVHAALLASPTLLERYREIAEPGAAALLAGGDHHAAERSRLLTRSGYEAALRVAQEHLEAARFGAAARTLEQLDAHPDRRGPGGADAAALAQGVASYTGAQRDWDRATLWARQSGTGEPDRAVVEPPAPPAWSVSSVGPGLPEAVDVGGIVRTPMRSAQTTPQGEDDREEPTRRVRSLQPVAWALPGATGEALYVNDGMTVSALDRFTLHPLWRARTLPNEEGSVGMSPLQRRLRGRIMDDACSVTIAGDVLLATTGMPTSSTGRRDGDGRLHAFDRHTGRVLWSADVSQAGADLEQASVRGPVVVVGDTAVVVARKSVPSRRLVTLYMIGLGLDDGAPRWTRLLATAGSLPFQQYNRVPQACVEADGVVYRCDEIGVAAAIDAFDGRPLWVRRLDVGNFLSNEQVSPWNTSAPLVVGDHLVLLGPSREELLVLDRQSGLVVASRRLDGGGDEEAALGEPLYLLRVGRHIACIGESGAAFVPLDDPAGGAVVRTPRVEGLALRGRCAVADGQVFMPVEHPDRAEVWVVDPAAPRDHRAVPVEHVGNTLALPGQIVCVDEAEAHSYLAWSSASALLERRLTRDPDDATAGVTLAELAFHAGKPERVPAAADAAMAALSRAPDEAMRRRLFESLLAMLQAAVAPEFPQVSPGVLGEVSARLDALAATPEERVAQRMLAGRLGERRGDTGAALEAYQSLLTDPALAAAAWRGTRLEVRAELEATRRIGALLRSAGIAAYAPFEERALREATGRGPDAARRVAAAYPFASVAPGLWLVAGEELAAEERPYAALRAWRAGLEAARTIREAGGQPDLPAVGELVGRLAGTLADQGRLTELTQALASARASFGPGFTPLDRGVPLDVDALLDASGRRLAARRLRPMIGTRPVVQETPDLLPGLVLEPLRRAGEGAHRRAVLVSGPRAELTGVGVTPGGAVETRWTRPVPEGVVPVVVEDTDERVVLFWPPGGDSAGRLEALDQASGATLWTSPSLAELFEPLPGPTPADRMIVPGGFDVPVSQVLVAAGARTVCLVERSGRAAAIDLRDGSALWAAALEVRRVADAVLAGGVLVVGGLDRSGSDVQPGEAPVGLVVAHEERTGQRLQRLEDLGGRVRWVRATDAGDAIVGADRAVSSVNLGEGRVNWTSAEPATIETLDAWVFNDRMVLLTADRALRGASVATGQVDTGPAHTRGRIDGTSAVAAWPMGERIVLASGEGIVVLGPRAEILGVDALETGAGLLPAAAGEGLLVTVESGSGRGGDWLHLLSAESARLLASVPLAAPPGVEAEPTNITLLDNHALIGFGAVTMVVPIPVE